MRKNSWYFGCFLAAAVVFGTAAAAQEETENPTETSVTEAGLPEERLFGDFTTMTLEGEETDQEIFAQAELTMVNIWATFCGPCIREMPDLGILSQEYKEQDVQIIGMIADVAEAKEETALAIVEYTQADYPHLILSEDLLQSYLGQVQVVPTTVFVDKEGKQVGEVYAGAKSKEEWAEILEELLQEQPETEL